MWLRLTDKDGRPVLVNSSRLVSITDQGVAKPTRIITDVIREGAAHVIFVKERLSQIKSLLKPSGRGYSVSLDDYDLD